MRLFLSSKRLGNHPEELLKLAGKNLHVGVILNAGDEVDSSRRAVRLKTQHDILRDLGFTSEEIDLRNFFGKKDLLAEHMKKFGLVWVRGGNIFFLQRAYEQSGFNEIIKQLLSENLIVYAGDSAGAVIVSPSLEGLEETSPMHEVPEGYEPEFSMNGLGLIDYTILPHYKSDHPDSAIVEKIAEEFMIKKIPCKTLRDGEVIIIEYGKERIIF